MASVGCAWCALCAHCRACGLPEPEREHKFSRYCNIPRRWRFDAAWPNMWIALEIEGGVFSRGRHTRGAGYVRDMEKYNAAAVLRWCVLRFTPEQVVSGDCMATVCAAFSERA